nr:MAG TPA: hypothetical protein [Caudoviricetes sp.]
MGKIKIAPNYSVFINGIKRVQNEVVEVEDTSRYIGKRYAIILEESTPKKEDKEDKKETSKGNRRKGKKEDKEADEIEDEIEAEDEVENK